MSKQVLYREYDEEGNLIKLECSKCGEIKSVDNFNKCKSKKDGYQNKCKKCVKIYQQKYNKINSRKIKERTHKYYQNNKDKILNTHKEYRKNNKTKINELVRQWREKNKDKCKEYEKQYYENNKEKLISQKKDYAKNNKEKILEYQRKYYEFNKEKMDKYYSEYRSNNKNKIYNYHHNRYENNKEYFRKVRRERYKNNKEKELEKQQQYRINNKDKINEHNHQRYENKVNEEIIKIYKNVTKNLYPNNDIQYGVIYGVHCIPTDRWYIGQTKTSFNIRYNGDFFIYKFSGLSEDNEKGQLLQDDIEKYGKDKFEIFEVLDVAFSEKELDEKEAYYIDYYKAYDEGYNSNRGNIFKHNKSKRKEVI